LAEIVQKDPGMCAKLLQIVNSACFGPMKTISKIDQAIVHLGMELFKNLALAAKIFSVFTETSPVIARSFESLQRHSLVTARIAGRIAPDPRKSQESFTAGLLHDIGKVALETCFPDRTETAALACLACNESSLKAEFDDLGTTHCEVGAYLLGLWGLPYPIVEAVAFHHSAQTAFDLTFIVKIAEILATEANGTARMPIEESKDTMDHLKSLNLLHKLPDWRKIAVEENSPS
jgi:putative nucleotidyltransferase with HDIG domain